MFLELKRTLFVVVSRSLPLVFVELFLSAPPVETAAEYVRVR